jgi:hypothetical protein
MYGGSKAGANRHGSQSVTTSAIAGHVYRLLDSAKADTGSVLGALPGQLINLNTLT